MSVWDHLAQLGNLGFLIWKTLILVLFRQLSTLHDNTGTGTGVGILAVKYIGGLPNIKIFVEFNTVVNGKSTFENICYNSEIDEI